MWVYLHPGMFYSYFPLDLVRSQEFCATETEMTSSLVQIINDRPRLKVNTSSSMALLFVGAADRPIMSII